ncbi:MAG TPA: hypothetical protein VFY73_01655 [Ideonella sp.]|uniref:hypothetical protein n=1 Tax=Ideonella sp. TaxID=1929293 RepID=UPI002E2FA747|nr:hypothetical protein [Ideonella sp.]HEX5682714.1 hypothetical protein [Ideonella sp.]
MRHFVLVCMLLLLPLQWSWAAASGHGAHAGHDTVLQPDASPSLAPASAGHDATTADTDLTGDDPCGHADDPQWVEPLAVAASLQYTAAAHFEYAAPTDSHTPARPERPERPLAA